MVVGKNIGRVVSKRSGNTDALLLSLLELDDESLLLELLSRCPCPKLPNSSDDSSVVSSVESWSVSVDVVEVICAVLVIFSS